MADKGACARCGQVHQTAMKDKSACVGHRRRDGAPCRKARMQGQRVCGSHGGSAPQARAAGRRREAERKAALAMRAFGGPIETTATEALLDTVKWTAGYVAWLRERVKKIANGEDEADLVWGKTQEKHGGEDWGTTYKSGPNVWLALLGEWQDRLVKVCSEAIKAGIEERKVRLAEQQGALVADVIKRILDDLGLSGEQLAKVSDVVPRHLRLLTA